MEGSGRILGHPPPQFAGLGDRADVGTRKLGNRPETGLYLTAVA